MKALGAMVAVPLLLVLASCGGTTAPAQPAAPPAASNLFIAADMVQGSKNVPPDKAALQSCVLSSRFPRNSEVVWRVKVADPITGHLMDDKDLKSVQVKTAFGKTLDLRFGPHPPNAPIENYWTTSWVVPKDQPTGSFKYTITATAADGRTGEWQPFPVSPSLPTILDEILPDVPTAG